MSEKLVAKIEELESQIENVDQKFTNALNKISDSMEKVAVALVKLEAQEETQRSLLKKSESLSDKVHDIDKRVDLAQQAANSTEQNAKEIKAGLNKLLYIFVGGFFSLIMAGIVFLIRT